MELTVIKEIILKKILMVVMELTVIKEIMLIWETKEIILARLIIICLKVVTTTIKFNYSIPNHFVISWEPLFLLLSFRNIDSIILSGFFITNSNICITGF